MKGGKRNLEGAFFAGVSPLTGLLCILLHTVLKRA